MCKNIQKGLNEKEKEKKFFFRSLIKNSDSEHGERSRSDSFYFPRDEKRIEEAVQWQAAAAALSSLQAACFVCMGSKLPEAAASCCCRHFASRLDYSSVLL